MNRIARREFLKTGTLGALGGFLFPGAATPHQARELTLYIGTYTSNKSEGIYVYRMNRASGELKRFSSTQSVNPSFLAIDRNRRYLYAVNEVNEFGGKPGGAVTAFKIDEANGTLKLLNQQANQKH